MADSDFPYLFKDKDRHGNTRIFVRVRGRKIRIRERRGTYEFRRAYDEALAKLKTPGPVATPRPTITVHRQGTLGWLGAQYFASEEFKSLDLKSQGTRRRILEECFRAPFTDSDSDPMGNCPLEFFDPQKVKRLMDLKVREGKKGAANNRKKYLSAMFGWAIESTPPLWTRANPARDVRKSQYASDGFHTWSVQEVERYEARHPLGTKARLALALLLYFGVRRSDVVLLASQNIESGWLRFIPRKTRYKRLRESLKPVLPVLAEIIAQSPCGRNTFLETEYGRPFTAAGFGSWFRDRCNEAGLPQCSAHGLRKAGAARAAENGATINQLMAIFDWDTPAQAKVYTDAADRKRLAGEAMHMLER